MPPELHPQTCMACLGCPGYRVEPCGFCGGNQAADANAPTADYAEILRLHRKYRQQDGDPLWKVFVRVGQRLEKAKPDRCKACFRTHLEYSRLVDATCDDPFHTIAAHTAEMADFLKSHQQQVANLLDEIERLRGLIETST